MSFGLRLALLGGVFALASSCRTPTNDSETKNFFENSRRRSASSQEAAQVVKTDVGCTGFWVANSNGLNLVGSATHCMNYAAPTWCSQGGTVTDADGNVRTCTNLVAGGDGTHDIVLFTVNGDPYTGPSFTLAGFAPAEKTRLRMTGYPVDPYATRGLMTTEDCWVLDSFSQNPYTGTDFYTKGLRDSTFSHNCSTYGGNSGGPMIIEGTDVVVGEPFTYDEGNFDNNDFSNGIAHGAAMADFVSTYRSALNASGVSITDTNPGNSSPAVAYFKAATYSAPGFNCSFSVIPLYETSWLLTRIKVEYNCQSGSDYVVYTCTDGTCTFSGSTIDNISASGFRYQHNGNTAYFTPNN